MAQGLGHIPYSCIAVAESMFFTFSLSQHNVNCALRGSMGPMNSLNTPSASHYRARQVRVMEMRNHGNSQDELEELLVYALYRIKGLGGGGEEHVVVNHVCSL